MACISPILRTTILRHELPDGSSHFDWLIERTLDEPRVLAFRLEINPLTTATWPIAGRQLPDHRRLYLDYEGPISGDRGTVARIANGNLRSIEHQTWTWNTELANLRGVLTARPCESSAGVLLFFARMHPSFANPV